MRIAHNPNTGEYIGEVNGKWEPLRVIQNDAGDMQYFDTGSGKWTPFNSVAGASQKVETPDNSKLSWLDVPGEMARNLWPSAKRVATEMTDAILNPKETAKTLANTVSGLASKAGITDLIAPDDIKRSAKEKEKYVDAIVQYGKDAYGTPEAIKQKVSKDPVGTFSDALALITGIGGGFKGASKLAGLAKAANAAENLGKAGDVFLNASRVADPLYGVSKGIGWLADKGYGRGMTAAQRAYLGVLKPSTEKYSLDDRIAMAQAAIDNQIPISTGGLKKATQSVRDLNDQIDAGIAAADASGRRIDPEKIAKGALWSDARETAARQNIPERDLNAFDEGVAEYLDTHGMDNTVAAAQEGKKATYRQYEKKYQNNAPNVNPGETEAAMELARQQRKAIEDAVPEVRGLNRQEGRMIDLRDNIEKALNRTANHNAFFNMRSMLPAIAAGSATGDFWSALAAGGLAHILSTPGVASRVPFLLENMSKRGSSPWLRSLMYGLYGNGQNNSVQNWFDQVYGNRR